MGGSVGKLSWVLWRHPWKWRSNYFKLQTVIIAICPGVSASGVCVSWRKDNRPKGWRQSPPCLLPHMPQADLILIAICHFILCMDARLCGRLILVSESVSLASRQAHHVGFPPSRLQRRLPQVEATRKWPLTDWQHATFWGWDPLIDHILDACPCMPHWQGQGKLKRNKSVNAARGKSNRKMEIHFQKNSKAYNDLRFVK